MKTLTIKRPTKHNQIEMMNHSQLKLHNRQNNLKIKIKEINSKTKDNKISNNKTLNNKNRQTFH